MRRRQRRLRQWLRHERLSVAMALAESTHHAALRGQKKARAGGGVRDALHGEVPGEPTSHEPGTQHFTATAVSQRSRAPSLTTSTRSGRRSGFCSTSWSRLETSLLGCLLSMLLCRRWWTSWRMCCRSLISSSLSRRSKSPRSPAFPVLLLVGFFLCRRRQNSWWTCHGWSGCGLHSAPTPLAGCGPACGCRPRGSTGSWRALA